MIMIMIMIFHPESLKPLMTMAFLAAFISACSEETASTQSAATETEQQLVGHALEIHERVITLDTHADINTSNFTPNNNYTADLNTQVNLPKMVQGGLDVAWFIVYTAQSTLDTSGYATAYANAIDKFDAIHRLAEDIAPDQIEIAYTSDDIRRIVAAGKKVAMIGVENAYPIGLDMANIKDFHKRGGRYMSLAHNGHNQFSDSNTGERDKDWLHDGLSEMGREAIVEMNKWGIIIDVSHPSKQAIIEMLDITRAPLIASHSSSRAMSEHRRNLDDEQLLRIKENGGVVQTVAFSGYLNAEKHAQFSEARDALITKIATDLGVTVLSSQEIDDLSETESNIYRSRMDEIDTLAAPRMEAEVNAIAAPVDVVDFVNHIDYIVDLIGLEHVGISSDFDGGGGISGWNDASETANVTIELVRRGYTEEQIGLLWSGNLLRVLDDVQRIAAEIQAE
tara:strand:- start:69383 stop:70738 length:1356 start_codon:yes stop_codon:yes gene_type:complete